MAVGADSEPWEVTGRGDSDASQSHGSGGSHPEQSQCPHPSGSAGAQAARMGDREAEHTVPQAELEQIASKISDLNKWREIFSFHG